MIPSFTCDQGRNFHAALSEWFASFLSCAYHHSRCVIILIDDRELELIPARTGFVPGMTSVKTSSGTKTKVSTRTPSRR